MYVDNHTFFFPNCKYDDLYESLLSESEYYEAFEKDSEYYEAFENPLFGEYSDYYYDCGDAYYESFIKYMCNFYESFEKYINKKWLEVKNDDKEKDIFKFIRYEINNYICKMTQKDIELYIYSTHILKLYDYEIIKILKTHIDDINIVDDSDKYRYKIEVKLLVLKLIFKLIQKKIKISIN